VSAINAAVVDPSGMVVLIVSLMGFPGPLTGAEVEVAGERLRSATAMVTAALAGSTRERDADPSWWPRL
jgi:DNA-binding IclR family transcriptional regulator